VNATSTDYGSSADAQHTPIAQIEIDYLVRIRETVARLIIVLNKIDLVQTHERERR